MTDMVNIELTQQQADELKDFYAIELEKIQRRADEIKGLLNKLGTEPLDISKPANSLTKVRLDTIMTVPQQKESVEAKTRATKNLNWSKYIIKVLNEQNKPMTIKQIIKSFEKQHNLDLPASKNSVMSLSQALYRLRVKDNIVKSSKIKGKREKRYGLIDTSDKSIILTDHAKAKKATSEIDIKREKRLPANTTYNWPQFIIDTLNKTKRVLSAKDFLKNAMVHYNLPKHEFKTTRGKISPVLSSMELKSKSLKTIKKNGQAGRFYGLPNWFDDDNKLKVDYK